MRTRTSGFKQQIKEMGRRIDSRITLQDDSVIYGNELFSINPILNTDILKSVMKGLKVECSRELEIGDKFKYEFGLLVGNSYEWIDFGYYYVNEKEYNEDTRNWSYTCYDKMLRCMVEYKGLQNGSFPITVRDYINGLLTDVGITFSDRSSEFTNYDRVIAVDPYIATDNSSLGYTYRDILDELSAVVAGNIMLDNSENAFIKYPTETNDTVDEEYFKDINVKFGEKFGPLNTVILLRSGDSDGIYKTYPESLPEEDRIAIEIRDNQIMNGNDRADYCQEILDKLKGLEFYLNDYTSTGILYYEALDLYTVSIGENTYKCLMLNDEPKIERGLVEDIYTELPDEVVSEYKNMSDDDRKINQVYIIVKKNEGVIEQLVSDTSSQGDRITTIETTVEGQQITINNYGNDIAEIKANIGGLQVDITKKGENLVRNSMLWNFDGWMGNTYQPLIESKTVPDDHSIIYWYCDETSSNYERGIIYQWNGSSWVATNLLRKDFYDGAGDEEGISIVQDKENYLSGNKFRINYDGSAITSTTGIYSELFEISPTQESITFQFKTRTEVTSGGVLVGIKLYNEEYVSRYTSDNYNVGTYWFKFNESMSLQNNKVQIFLKNVLNVLSGSTAPTSTSNYWLDTSDSEDYVLKKYDEESSSWINYVYPGFIKDQSNNYYRFRIYNGVGYYELWANDRSVRYGEIIVLQDGSVSYPELTLDIGDIKVEYGVATDWSPRQDENYSITHRMDANGYTIMKGDNQLFLDEDEMTGYFRDNKMFYINKNEVYSQISKCIEQNINGLITKRTIVNNKKIYIRYIEED